MSNQPLVSVQMAVYNCEQYVGQAIESILQQTFTDFEFIIVDDGSTDRTGQILTAYAAQDSRIIVLRNEVIPIIDLRARLYPQLKERSEQPLVLITHSSAGVIGIKVDAVRRIVNVSTDALLPPPPIIRGIRGELLIAIVPYEDEVYLLIDIENILSGDEKRELAEADLSQQVVDSTA